MCALLPDDKSWSDLLVKWQQQERQKEGVTICCVGAPACSDGTEADVDAWHVSWPALVYLRGLSICFSNQTCAQEERESAHKRKRADGSSQFLSKRQRVEPASGSLLTASSQLEEKTSEVQHNRQQVAANMQGPEDTKAFALLLMLYGGNNDAKNVDSKNALVGADAVAHEAIRYLVANPSLAPQVFMQAVKWVGDLAPVHPIAIMFGAKLCFSGNKNAEITEHTKDAMWLWHSSMIQAALCIPGFAWAQYYAAYPNLDHWLFQTVSPQLLHGVTAEEESNGHYDSATKIPCGLDLRTGICPSIWDKVAMDDWFGFVRGRVDSSTITPLCSFEPMRPGHSHEHSLPCTALIAFLSERGRPLTPEEKLRILAFLNMIPLAKLSDNPEDQEQVMELAAKSVLQKMLLGPGFPSQAQLQAQSQALQQNTEKDVKTTTRSVSILVHVPATQTIRNLCGAEAKAKTISAQSVFGPIHFLASSNGWRCEFTEEMWRNHMRIESCGVSLCPCRNDTCASLHNRSMFLSLRLLVSIP